VVEAGILEWLDANTDWDDRMIRFVTIPDIESVNYGRGVGYTIEEHQPPADVAAISGTAIRGS